jgi:integrase
VLTKTRPDRLHNYIVLSLLTGARTEELRALRWENVHLDGDAKTGAATPVHGGLAVSTRRRRHQDAEVASHSGAAESLR